MELKIKDIKIKISFPFVSMIALALVSKPNSYYLLSILAAFFHETGHFIAMYFCKGRVKEISLSVFDFKIIDKNINTRTKFDDIIITMMGCVSNFIIAILCLCVKNNDLTYNFMICNLLIGIFNILPISSFDGGRILTLLLDKYEKSIADRILFIISLITVLPLFVFGIIIIIRTKCNYSLLAVSIYLILIMILKKDGV